MNRSWRSRSQARLLVLLVVALALPPMAPGQDSTAPTSPQPPVKDFSDCPAYAVLGVRAGNLLVVRLEGQETTIRLIGTYVPQSSAAVDEARLFTGRLLQGESVYVQYDPNWPARDREEYTWAYVYRAPDGLFVNLELVRQGYARVSAAEPFEHQHVFRAYERVARKAQKGLWGPGVAQAIAPATSQPAARTVTQPASAAPATDGDVVYVTATGQKYHRKDCQFVRNGATALTVTQAKAQGYTPCSRCKPPQ